LNESVREGFNENFVAPHGGREEDVSRGQVHPATNIIQLKVSRGIARMEGTYLEWVQDRDILLTGDNKHGVTKS
jgi:hypothetical protein